MDQLQHVLQEIFDIGKFSRDSLVIWKKRTLSAHTKLNL